jgi:hypothetical protein
MPEYLEPQAALEQAVVNFLRRSATSTPYAGLAYKASECDRTYDAQPPPAVGDVFVSVWSPLGRHGVVKHTSGVEEPYTVMVTISLRATLPFDRWLRHRDDVERRANRVIDLIAPDALDYRVTREAAALAGFEQGASLTAPIGWVEALNYEDMGDVEEVGPSWFQAETESEPGMPVGFALTVRFGGNRRVRKLSGL